MALVRGSRAEGSTDPWSEGALVGPQKTDRSGSWSPGTPRNPAQRPLGASLSAASLALGGPGTTSEPFSVATADLDGDGDQDLVSANQFGDNLTVFFQLSPGSFAAAPLALGGSATTNAPVSVAAADLDEDGDQDLVSANFDGNNLTVFFQLSPKSFAAAPLALGGSATTNFPESVAAADLDGDGDQDLFSANVFGLNLTVFFGGR